MKRFLSRSLPVWMVAVLLMAGAPWEQPRVPVVTPIDGTGGLKAKDCGVCHQEIYREWASSSHGWAWTDPQFQGELAKDPQVGWLCLNCHTPLANQQPHLVIESGVTRSPEMNPNPDFDPALREDGVGCLTCHWRPEGIAGPHKDVSAPHPVVYDPGLQDTQTCTTCHQAKARLEDALVCHFNTGEEWDETASGKTCQDCHMPEVHRASAAGAPVRKTRRHTWFGGGVPKGPIDPAIQPLWDAWKPGYDLSLSAPEVSKVGDEVRVTANLRHARAGHLVPTGDPERHLMVDLKVVSGDTVIGQSQARIGQRWEWSPVARQISDNRLKPGETRQVELRFAMPDAPVQVRATVTHVRLTEANWRYHVKLFEDQGKSELAESLKTQPRERERASAQATITLQAGSTGPL